MTIRGRGSDPLDRWRRYGDKILQPSPLSLIGMTDVAEFAQWLQPPPLIRSVLTRAHRVWNATRVLDPDSIRPASLKLE